MVKSTRAKTNNRTTPIRAEQASGDGQGFFQALIENSLDAVVVVSKDGRIKYESRSIELVLGYEYGKFIGKSPLDLVHPEDIKVAADALVRLIEGRDTTVLEQVRVRHADGSWRHVEAFGKYLLDDPSVQGIVVSFRDITDFRQREEMHRELEAWSSALVENARDGITVFQDGIIRFANGTLADITGYSIEELTGMYLTDLVVPEHQDKTGERYEAYMKGEPPKTFNELRIQCKNGEIKTIEASGTAINYNGKPAIMGIVRDISARKQVEEALRESEDKWRVLVQSAPERVMMVDREGTIIYINRVTPGRTVDEVIGTSIYDYTFPKDIATVRKVLKSVFQLKKSEKYEATAVAPDGAKVCYENSAAPLERNGEVVAAIIISLDITERKRVEEELQRREEYFRALIENSSDFIAVINAEGKIVYQSPLAEQVLGYDRAYQGAKTSLELVHPDDLPNASEALTELVRNPGSMVQAEVRAKHKDGSWHIFEVTGRNLLDDPIVGGIVANFRDITKRKQAEESLTQSEEKWRSLVENAPERIVLVDSDGTILFGNRTSPGHTVEEVIGTSIFDYTVKRNQARAKKAHKSVFQKGEPQKYEMEAILLDGSKVWFEMSVAPIKSGDQVVQAIYVALDITERKLTEEELRRARNELETKVKERTSDLERANRELSIRIAEARQAEQALRESEKRYRELAELLPQMVFETDKKGDFTFTNRKAFATFGYTEEEIENGFNAFQTLIPEDSDRARKNMKRVLAGEKFSGNEYTALRKDGSTFPILIFSSPITRDNKQVGLRGVVVDLTERKQMEDELRESEKRFRSLIENSSDVIVIINEDGTIRYESPSVEHILGYTHEELIGQHGFFALHQDDLPRVTEDFTQLMQDPGGMMQIEILYQHKDGSWRNIEAIGHNLINDPAIRGIVVNFRDITARKQAEEALKESEEHFRALIEHSLDAIAILTEDGTIQYLSPSVERVLGYKTNELLGENPFKLVHKDDMANATESFAHLLKNPGATIEEEIRVYHKDGSWRIIELIGSNLLNEPSVAAIVANFRDVTERKQADAVLQEHLEQEKGFRQQLEAEMKKRVEFTRALAHELKTPLTAVLSSSDLLASELSAEPLSSLARNIRQGASNLNSRIDELLDVARGEVGMLQLKHESFDLLQLLRETVDSMTPQALERGQSLTFALPHNLPAIQADAIRVQQVVTNLINNAIKFTPRGGKITLRARESNSTVTVEVQDTGRGIPKEERERIFEPYERLKGDRDSLSGLGLGLYLSKTLVELHGGQIWAKGHTGRGSTFGFTLPVKTATKQVKEQEQVTKLWKVLIIEDDREIVDSISLSFRLRWPEAELVSTGLGEEGVEMVEAEDPDIVILDLGLPDISGFEALRQIRLFSSVPVIILTVKGEETDMVKGLEWGADDYIVKPFRQLELLARLKVQLRKRTPPDEEAPIICGALRLDPSTFQLTYGGKEISLTIVEGRIIEHLMRNAGHVVTHARLAEAVWGEDYPGAIDSLRVYIRYLRQKIEKDSSHPKLILTKAGIGYSLVKPT